ncbi:hypothetical protein E2320_003090, partial [Naja naja]
PRKPFGERKVLVLATTNSATPASSAVPATFPLSLDISAQHPPGSAASMLLLFFQQLVMFI